MFFRVHSRQRRSIPRIYIIQEKSVNYKEIVFAWLARAEYAMISRGYNMVDKRLLQLFYWPNVIRTHRRFE